MNITAELVYAQTEQAVTALLQENRPHFNPVKLLVIGGSSSEIAGGTIGHNSTYEYGEAVVEAVKTPVTVKTRLGYDNEHREIVDIAERLQDVGIAALTIHGRLRTTKYSEPADWTLIGAVKNNPRMHIPIIGNGDVVDGPSAKYYKDTYGVDGLMIGRATYGNPWIFSQIRHYLETGEELPLPDVKERVRVSKIHLQRSIEWKGEHIALLEIRKHWASYFKGLPNFKPFKMRLMETLSVEEILEILNEVENCY